MRRPCCQPWHELRCAAGPRRAAAPHHGHPGDGVPVIDYLEGPGNGLVKVRGKRSIAHLQEGQSEQRHVRAGPRRQGHTDTKPGALPPNYLQQVPGCVRTRGQPQV